MSDNLQFSIAFLIGFILAVYLFVKLCIKGRTNGNKLKEKAERDGTITKANAIKHSRRRGSEYDEMRQSVTVWYEYDVSGKKYKKKLTYYDSGTVKYNDSIEIYYDKLNPKKSIALPEINGGQEKQKGCLIAIVIPIIVIAAIYWLLRLI